MSQPYTLYARPGMGSVIPECLLALAGCSVSIVDSFPFEDADQVIGDVFIAVITEWRPRRSWYEDNGPKLAAVSSAVRVYTSLEAAWTRNFPPQG